MSRLYIFLKTKKYSTQGLTLVEVIVGMLISALFLSTALQAYVSAVSIKAKAQHADVVITTIHSDAETVRQIAQEIPTDADACKGNLLRKAIENVRSADTEQLNARSNPPSGTVNPIEEKDGKMNQLTTWPLIPNSNEYEFHRTFSTDDQSGVNPSNLLYVFYKITYRDSEAQIGDKAAVEPKTVAQLRTSVMPNAVLVCP